jgi:hypothetical protein
VRRLETATAVDNVEVERVRGLEPTLAATVVEVTVVVVIEEDRSPTGVESALETAPGAERVEATGPANREPSR